MSTPLASVSIAVIGLGTAGSNSLDILPDIGAVSALLEESRVKEPFSLFFGATWTREQDIQDETATTNIKFSQPETPVIEPSDWRAAARRQWDSLAREEAAVRANVDRITLLARQYIAKEQFSDEETARLAILTERLRKLSPAVTSSELDALEGVLNTVRKISDSDKDIRVSLGLDPLKNA